MSRHPPQVAHRFPRRCRRVLGTLGRGRRRLPGRPQEPKGSVGRTHAPNPRYFPLLRSRRPHRRGARPPLGRGCSARAPVPAATRPRLRPPLLRPRLQPSVPPAETVPHTPSAPWLPQTPPDARTAAADGVGDEMATTPEMTGRRSWWTDGPSRRGASLSRASAIRAHGRTRTAGPQAAGRARNPGAQDSRHLANTLKGPRAT